MPSAQGDVIRATAELVSRLGEVASGLPYEETDCVCSAGTIHAGTAVNVVPDLGPGHRHAAHLHRGAARGGPGPPAGPVRPGRRRPGRPRGARGARAHPCRGQRRRGHRRGGGGGERGARPRPGLPDAAGRRRATTSASSCATCRAATSSSAAARRTVRAGCTTARPSWSRTSPCGSGPACWCAAPWHWPRRDHRGHNGPMTASDLFDIAGKTALVTGGSRGIGQNDRRGLRGRRREGLHFVAQGRRGGGGRRRALREGHLHRHSGRPLHRGRVPAPGRRSWRRARTPSTSSSTTQAPPGARRWPTSTRRPSSACSPSTSRASST